VNELKFYKLNLENLIFGSKFNSLKKLNALEVIKSSHVLSDFFELKNDIINQIDENAINYDLTHSLGNFLDAGNEINILRSTKKLAIEGDFVISRLRSYLKEMAVVQKSSKTQVFSTEYLVYRKINPNILSTNTLLAYCLTNEVQTILNCSQYGTEHPRFYEFVLNRLPIPDSLLSINDKIDRIFGIAYSVREQSRQIYAQAETLLLEALGTKDFKPSKEKVNVKSFKESFLSKGRLDAEYYQPKYEQIVNKIKSQNYFYLKELVSIKKSIEPGSAAYSEKGLPFLRVADYNKFGITEPQKCLSDEFCKGNADLISELKPKKETILFSKDGSVGKAYKLKEDKNIITSGAVLHLTVKNKKQVLPEYLTLILNSQLIQMQAERDAGGSIILHWRVGEIENVVVPIIDFDKQQEISDKIEDSFRLRKQSEQLLALAKTAVEKAIEEGEEKAMGFINERIEQLK